MTLLTMLDLSANWGPPRFQALRQTCLAFALSELNQHANHLSDALSPEYLYLATAHRMTAWPTEGLALAAALDAVDLDGQPDEVACPYTTNEPAPNSPLPPVPPPMRCFSFKDATVSVPNILTSLANGVPTGLVIKLTPSFFHPDQGVIAYSSQVIPDRAHAVIATGHAIDQSNGDHYILARNTWGSTWGAGGSAWLPTEYVEQHAVIAFSA